jgi:hypothetical protein
MPTFAWTWMDSAWVPGLRVHGTRQCPRQPAPEARVVGVLGEQRGGGIHDRVVAVRGWVEHRRGGPTRSWTSSQPSGRTAAAGAGQDGGALEEVFEPQPGVDQVELPGARRLGGEVTAADVQRAGGERLDETGCRCGRRAPTRSFYPGGEQLGDTAYIRGVSGQQNLGLRHTRAMAAGSQSTHPLPRGGQIAGTKATASISTWARLRETDRPDDREAVQRYALT